MSEPSTQNTGGNLLVWLVGVVGLAALAYFVVWPLVGEVSGGLRATDDVEAADVAGPVPVSAPVGAPAPVPALPDEPVPDDPPPPPTSVAATDGQNARVTTSCREDDGGGKLFRAGSATGAFFSGEPFFVEDRCLPDGHSIVEYWCTSDELVEAEFDCLDPKFAAYGFTSCVDGACVSHPPDEPDTLHAPSRKAVPTVMCRDDDDGNDLRERARTFGLLKDGTAFNLTDHCLDDGRSLIEYWCEKGEFVQATYDCLGPAQQGAGFVGCQRGACVTSGQAPVEEAPSGQLGRADIMKVVRGSMPRLKRCFEKDSVRYALPCPRLQLEWTITTAGRVQHLTVDSTPEHLRLNACVAREARRWRFPMTSEPTNVTYPIIVKCAGS